MYRRVKNTSFTSMTNLDMAAAGSNPGTNMFEIYTGIWANSSAAFKIVPRVCNDSSNVSTRMLSYTNLGQSSIVNKWNERYTNGVFDQAVSSVQLGGGLGLNGLYYNGGVNTEKDGVLRSLIYAPTDKWKFIQSVGAQLAPTSTANELWAQYINGAMTVKDTNSYPLSLLMSNSGGSFSGLATCFAVDDSSDLLYVDENGYSLLVSDITLSNGFSLNTSGSSGASANYAISNVFGRNGGAMANGLYRMLISFDVSASAGGQFYITSAGGSRSFTTRGINMYGARVDAPSASNWGAENLQITNTYGVISRCYPYNATPNRIYHYMIDATIFVNNNYFAVTSMRAGSNEYPWSFVGNTADIPNNNIHFLPITTGVTFKIEPGLHVMCWRLNQ